jgi:hypothetical protein
MTDSVEKQPAPGAATPSTGKGGLPMAAVDQKDAVVAAEPESPRVSGLLDALSWGFRSAWACKRLLVFILAANFLLAVAVLFPLLGPMEDSLSHHPEADRIGGQLDVRWWGDWTSQAAGQVTQTRNIMSLAGFVMVFAGTFFAGGLLEALRHGPTPLLKFDPLPDPYYKGATPEWRAASPGPATIRRFLRSSTAHFPRLGMLLLLSMPAYWLVQSVMNKAAVAWLGELLEGVEDERMALLITMVRAALFVITFQAVTVFFEYGRIHEVLKPGAPFLAILGMPFKVFRARPGLFLGIELSAFLLHLALMMAFIPVDKFLGEWSLLAVTAGLAATQIFMFLRILIRTGTQGAQIRLAQSTLA